MWQSSFRYLAVFWVTVIMSGCASSPKVEPIPTDETAQEPAGTPPLETLYAFNGTLHSLGELARQDVVRIPPNAQGIHVMHLVRCAPAGVGEVVVEHAGKSSSRQSTGVYWTVGSMDSTRCATYSESKVPISLQPGNHTLSYYLWGTLHFRVEILAVLGSEAGN